METRWEWVVFHQKWVEGGGFCRKMGGIGSFFLKTGWEWVVSVEKWVGVCRFCRKMGGSG